MYNNLECTLNYLQNKILYIKNKQKTGTIKFFVNVNPIENEICNRKLRLKKIL